MPKYFADGDGRKAVAVIAVLMASFLVAGSTGAAANAPLHDADRYALIYYANESSAHFLKGTNIPTLLEWLNKITLKSAVDARRTIERDMKRFSATVEDESKVIQRVAPRQMGVAILTNASLLRDGHYLVKAPGNDAFSPVKIDPALQSDEVRFESNPLNDHQILRLLLSDAVSRIAGDGRSVVLVVKSHGNEALALMPRSFVDTTRSNLKTVREYLSHFEATGLMPTPPWLAPVGVDKRDFMATLDEIAEKHGIRFGALFLEACEGGVGLYGITHSPNDQRKRPFARWRLAKSVEYFVSGGAELLEYRNIDYERLMRRTDEIHDFRSAFLAEALRSGLIIQQHSDYWPSLVRGYAFVLWFVPLGCWLIVVGVLAARKELPNRKPDAGRA